MENYRVKWLSRETGRTTDISRRAGGAALSDDLDSICRSMTINVAQGLFDRGLGVLPIQPGDRVLFYKDGSLIFDGQVNVCSGNYRGSMQLAAYDDGVLLAKNDVILQCNGIAADQAIRQLCARLGVPVRRLPAMPAVIDKLYREAASGVVEDILSTVTAETGVEYFVRVLEGALSILPQGFEVVSLPERRLGDPSVKISAENLRNAVQIYSDRDDTVTILAQAVDTQSQARYGRRMKVATYSDKDESTAGQKAKTLLQGLNTVEEDITLKAHGLDGVQAGVLLRLDLPEVSGTFLVKAVSKSFGTTYTMDMTLRRWKSGLGT